MNEGKQTNIVLTAHERMALKEASGDPCSHGAIINGLRAIIAFWQAAGCPELPQPQEATDASRN